MDTKTNFIHSSVLDIASDQNGLGFFTVFSDKDGNKKGKIAHFFTDDDLKEHFKDFTILESGHFTEQLSYTHQNSAWVDLRYIIVLKK